MENFSQNYYESIKKALKKVGLKVGEIEKQGKKTIINVVRYETRERFAISKEKKESNE